MTARLDAQQREDRDADLLGIVHDPASDPAAVARAREELVRMHLPLVRHIARRFADRGEPIEDLVQVGSIGLLKSIDRFDPGRGVGLSSYATPTIVGEIKRHFRDRGWSVKVPRRLQELGLAVRRTNERLAGELGRSPTTAEIAAAMEVSADDVLEAMTSAQAYSTSSLDTSVSGDEQNLASTLGADDVELALVVDREALRPALEGLEPRQRQILVMRFFGHRTQSEIAEQLGISQVHVSRLLKRTLAQLRDEMDG